MGREALLMSFVRHRTFQPAACRRPTVTCVTRILLKLLSDHTVIGKECTIAINFNQILLGLSGWLGYRSVTIC